MYEALFYTPSDFEESDSEQHLSVYQGALSVYPSASRLGVVRALLNNELDVQFERSKGYDNWNFPEKTGMVAGKREVTDYYRLIADSTHLKRFDVSSIRHFWKVKDDWNDVVIVGAASEAWFVLHWYTTA